MGGILRRILTVLAVGFVVVAASLAPAHAGKRVALVIGINRYEHLPTQLQKAVNDARAVRRMLIGLGFKPEDIVYDEDVSRQRLIEKLQEFAARLEKDDLAFVFYSGHGFQLGDSNLLLPSDTPRPSLQSNRASLSLDDQRRLEEERIAHGAVAEAEIHRVIRNRQAHIGIIVLDACRNNPLRIAERDNPYKDAFPGELVFGKDLGRIVPPVTSTRMLGLYSAEHGQRALDRLSENDNNPNSPFTRVLIKSLVVPGVELRNAVVELQSEVYGLTQKIGYDQAPAYYDQMRGLRVYLAGPPAALIQLPTSPAPPPKYFAVEPAETAPGPQRAECAPVPPAASTPEAQARLAMIDADWHKALDAATGRTAKAVEGFLKVHPESWRACEAIAVFNELGVFEAALKDAQPVAALEHYVATFGGKALQGVAARHRIDELRYAEKKAACDSIVKAAMVTVAEARNEGCDIGGEHWGTNPVIQTSRCLLASPEGRDGEVSRRQTELAACKDDKAEDKAFAVAMAVAGGQSPHGTAKTSGKATAAKSGQSLQGTAGASPELANVHTGIAGLRNGVAAMDGFLKAWPQRRRAVEAGAEKARLESAIEPLLASIRDIDRAKWAEAERSPLEVAGYNAYLAMLPEGESRELAKAAKADLEACNAAVAADDVAQMKAYRDNFPDGRCRSRLAALIAPPTDLTGARLGVVEPEPSKNKRGKSDDKARVDKSAVKIEDVILSTDNSQVMVHARSGSDFSLWSLDGGTGHVRADRGWRPSGNEQFGPYFLPGGKAGIEFAARYDYWGREDGVVQKDWSITLRRLSDGHVNAHIPKAGTNFQKYRSSESGQHVVVEFDDKLKIWETATAKLVRSFEIAEKDADIERMAMSGDGHWLAALSKWNATIKKLPMECRSFPDADDAVNSVLCSRNPEGAACSRPVDCSVEKRAVRIFDVREGKLLRSIGARTTRRRLLSSSPFEDQQPAGRGWAKRYEAGVASNPQKGAGGYEFVDQEIAITAVDISRDGKRLFIGYQDGRIDIRDLATDRSTLKSLLAADSEYPIVHMFELPSQNAILVEQGVGTATFGVVPLVQPSSGAEANGFKPLQNTGLADVIARGVSPDGRFLAVATERTVHLWNISSGKYLAWLKLLPDGGYVTATPSGAFTASENALAHLTVEIGKRRWPLADVPAFKAQFFKPQGIDLLAQ